MQTLDQVDQLVRNAKLSAEEEDWSAAVAKYERCTCTDAQRYDAGITQAFARKMQSPNDGEGASKAHGNLQTLLDDMLKEPEGNETKISSTKHDHRLPIRNTI